jgi:hypothetical protein
MQGTLDSGLPDGVRGMASAPGGVITAPSREMLLGWRRDAPPARVGDQMWLLGVHGGAGVTTLRRSLGQAGILAGDAGRAWPAPDPLPVLVVARTHGRGIRTAQAAALQYLSKHTPEGTRLLGCLLVPDGPGRLPRQMVTAARSQISGVFAETLAAPWVEEYRLYDAEWGQEWPPLPAEMEQLAERITQLLAPNEDSR